MVESGMFKHAIFYDKNKVYVNSITTNLSQINKYLREGNHKNLSQVL